ncbi:hypothetical protein FPRO05_07113 [Fusarium proliferatum]|uniref:Clr5 domain-containing protein n=1 Tax=Gibberella intermedia TaxID=948311 RepID=A0A365MJT5_GIBIN|nr:hypothetical protein FPRO05_07113 [Fusarium proliferatum]
MSQAARIPTALWEAQRARITKLYVDQDKTLDEVIQIMDDSGFHATKSQYIRKVNVNWKLQKNYTKEKWQHASALVEKRQAEGKLTKLSIDGKVISEKRQRKELRRYHVTLVEEELNECSAYELLKLAISSGFLIKMKHLFTMSIPTLEIFARHLLFVALEVQGSKGIEFLNFLLESGVSPDSIGPNDCRYSALHKAVRLADHAAVQLLLQFGADPNGKLECTEDDTPLNDALYRSADRETAKMLIESGADVNLGFEKPLIKAVKGQDLALVKLLLEAGADPKMLPAKGLSVLYFAINKHELSLVNMLIHAGVSPNLLIYEFHDIESLEYVLDIFVTPLQHAVFAGDVGIVKRLVEGGAVLDIFMDPKMFKKTHRTYLPYEILTPLQLSIQEHQYEIIKVLLDAGAGVDFRHPATGTALQNGTEVLESPWTTLARAFISSALKTAVRIGFIDHILGSDAESFTTHPFTIPEEDVSSLICESIWTRDTRVFNLLMQSFIKTDLDFSQPGYPTPLWLAIHQGGEYMAERLLNVGANPNQPSLALAKLLIEAGADVNASKTELAKLIVGAGAYVNTSSIGTCALGLATIRNKFELFLAGGVDANESTMGKTVLQRAASQGNLELVKLLIDLGANVNAKAPGSLTTVLQYASMQSSVEIVKYLVEHGASINEKASTVYKATALGLAVANNHNRIAIYLIEQGASTDKCHTTSGATLLQLAAKHRNHEIVTYLVENGAAVNAAPSTDRGATALQFAAIYGNLKMAVFLIEHGAHVSAKGAEVDGRTALEGAAEHGRLDMVHLLLGNDEEPETIEERCCEAAKFAETEHHDVIARILRNYKKP